MWPFSRKKKPASEEKALTHPGGWRTVLESYPGAWQQNHEIDRGSIRDYFAIYACMTLISADVSKMTPEAEGVSSNSIWRPIDPAWSSILSRPNRYQNWMQFAQWWMTSKLAHGNAYALKERNNGIQALYILDPDKVEPLIADDGQVYYRLEADKLATIRKNQIVVSADEIIHDRYQPQFHPLIGVSPLYAAALSGALGAKIQQDSLQFFGNGAKPGGILTAPGAINRDTAERLQEDWQTGYTGKNAGRVAVVGDGLKFEPMRSRSIDSQLVEQLKLSSDVVCAAFHVPPYKIGMQDVPAGGPEAVNLIYYTDCLQVLVQELEQCLMQGLELADGQRIKLDTDDLMRMDTKTQYETLGTGVGKSLLAPNEARARINKAPMSGGDSIYMQQQNYSLEALAKRDAMPNPFDSQGGRPPEPPEPDKSLSSIDARDLREELTA